MSTTVDRLRHEESRSAGSLSQLDAIGRPGLGVITFAEQGGGVAYVARLLRLALSDDDGSPPLSVALDAASPSRVSPLEAARFAGRLLAANARGLADWFMFGHVGIARAQHRIPGALRRPYAVQMHGTEVWEPTIPEAVHRAALRIAPSRYTAQRAHAAHPTLGEIVVCPHGLLPDDGADGGAVDESLVARVGPHAAIIIGRLWSVERRKGHDELLECWPTVLAAVPDAQLVVVGTGDDEPRYREKARQLGVADHVLFTGWVSNATRRALLARAALYVMPSRQEGFGIVYLEAMKAGLPCIGATDDGATEPIVHGDTGLLVEQADRRALAEAVAGLLGNAELRRSMGEAGRERYEAEFTFDRYRARLRSVLRERFVDAPT